jgi:hypothetical protein
MPSQKKEKSTSRILYVMVAGVAILLLFFLFSVSFSSITGTEFSPNNFQSRSFSYTRFPGTKMRLTSTKLGPSGSAISGDVLRYVRKLQGEPQWHVESVSGLETQSYPAAILIQCLSQRDSNGDDFWGAWSANNANAAGVFWPLVQQAAVAELYFLVPDLLNTAEMETEPQRLESEVLQQLANGAADRIEVWKASQDHLQIKKIRDWYVALPVTSGLPFGIEDGLRIIDETIGEIDKLEK